MVVGFNSVGADLRHSGLRYFSRFVAIGAAAGSLAAVSAYAMRPLPEVPASSLPQISNVAAKSDRLAIAVRGALHTDLAPSLAFAEVVPAIAPSRFTEAVEPQPAPANGPVLASVTSKPVELNAAPLPPRKPKRAPETSEGLLDDAQIAGIRTRLRLTPPQEEYWPAVEAALREVGRVHFRRGALRANGSAPNIDVNSPEVQKLIWAAMPLLRQLREDQKREVRQLVRVIGLHSVAAHI
jgi:hypothetical protein